MYQGIADKWLFIIFNIGPEAMNILYECEFTVLINHIDQIGRGKPTKLLQGMSKPLDDL